MKNIFERSQVSVLALLLLINTLTIGPLLTSGYIADDILNSQIRGALIQTGHSLWSFTSYAAMLWVRNEGRLIPLAFYAYSVFYFLRTVVLYKLFVFVVILASIAAFYLFLRRLARSERLAVIAALLLPLMFQFRASWDPILAFCAQYPMISLLLFSSLNLFLRAVDEGNRLALWSAVALFICGSLIFEVTYPMCLVYALVAYLRLRNARLAVRKSWPFLAVTACLVSVSIILRARAAGISETYTMYLDWARVIRTYFVQLWGAIPFSYFLFDPHAVFINRAGRWPPTVVQILPLVVLVAALSVLTLWRKFSGDADRQDPADHAGTFAVGVFLLAIPPSLISLSPKFQAQTWGDAYLPVYITCFGLSTLLAVGLEKLYALAGARQRARTWAAPLALCVWLLLLASTFRNNYLISQVVNKAVWSPRVLLENALRRGLLAGISPKSLLLVNGVEPWDNANEYSMKTGIRFKVYRVGDVHDSAAVFTPVGGTCATTADRQVCEFAANAPVYTVQIRHLADGTGAVLLARLETSYQSYDSVYGLFSHEVTAYFRLPDSAQPLAVALSGRNNEKETDGPIFRTDEDDLDVLNRGPGWKLVHLKRAAAFDALSLRGEISAEHPGSDRPIPKGSNALTLHASGQELLHIGYESRVGNGVELPPINCGDDLSVEVIVVPADSQRASADILSNHWVDWRGMAVEQANDQTNRYFAALGTGKRFIYVGDFGLATGRRNYISLQVKDGVASLYQDGNPVSHKILTEPFAQSPYPVWLGNWKGGDHPFNGWIREVLIAKGAKSADAVLRDAKRLSLESETGLGTSPK